jgi:large subunit ribosomal protein L22
MATAAQPLTSIEAQAVMRYLRVSPQKARLVIDLIRGRRAAEALHVLRFTKKRVARDVEKVLRSAIANAERKAEEAGETLDPDTLWVARCFVNEGPRWKRIRPSMRGMAHPYQRRTSHVVIAVAEHRRAAEQRIQAAAAEAEAEKGVKGAVRKVRKRIQQTKKVRTPKKPKKKK